MKKIQNIQEILLKKNIQFVQQNSKLSPLGLGSIQGVAGGWLSDDPCHVPAVRGARRARWPRRRRGGTFERDRGAARCRPPGHNAMRG